MRPTDLVEIGISSSRASVEALLQMVNQPVTGRLNEVQHMFETCGAAAIWVGHDLAIGGCGELHQPE
jgi:hypothetical protein